MPNIFENERYDHDHLPGEYSENRTVVVTKILYDGENYETILDFCGSAADLEIAPDRRSIVVIVTELGGRRQLSVGDIVELWPIPNADRECYFSIVPSYSDLNLI